MTVDKKYVKLELESGTYETTLNRTYKSRQKWVARDQKEVLSFMPGMVVEYVVKVGDKVKQGDVLLIFKAMKMNNRLLAPVSGVVKRLGVKEGVNVPKNELLVELE